MATKISKKARGYALAGQIVTTPQAARRILIEATRDGREWLIPQARNVAALLSRKVAA